MKCTYSKQAEKFLNKVDDKTKCKLENAIVTPTLRKKLIKTGKFSGNRYGIKLEHYRIVIDVTDGMVHVITVNTKTNMKKLKYGYF